MSTTSSTGAAGAVNHQTRADWRGFWRILLAVVAPVPAIALAVSNLVTPNDLGGSAQDQISAVAADQPAAWAAMAFSTVFLAFLVPSGVALLMAMRRVVPRAATVVMGFITLAFCAGATIPSSMPVALITVREGLDPATAATIIEQMEALPTTVVAIIPFALTITLGRIILGVVLWRARIAPRWMAVAMVLSTPVEFAGDLVGNTGAALAYVLTSIGFASASWALLHMSNDEFDLPPLP